MARKKPADVKQPESKSAQDEPSTSTATADPIPSAPPAEIQPTEPAAPAPAELPAPTGETIAAEPATGGATPEQKPPEPPPLRSVHTSNFPLILRELGLSVIVTTYQAGKLVILRADGDHLNTHFRNFRRPMGLALGRDRMAIGTTWEIWEYHNVPAVCRRLDPPTKHDACFLPRSATVTGDIQIHEMAFDGQGELWFVNTRFSCLCTRSAVHSFIPRWRPPFITALEPSDRCHLNGMAMVDGQPRYVTALGKTDTPGGWRERKKDGGILMDVSTGEILLEGLSMPHSPRWHGNRLWLLESGAGTIGYFDRQARRYQAIAQMPGFTRGFDIQGRFAFIGLSQVRETAVFSGIPIAEKALAERACGVWVIDLATGQTIAFLRFEDAVQEIFAVQLLRNRRFPDLINDNPALLTDSFVLPDEALAQVPEPLRSNAPAPLAVPASTNTERQR